MDLVQVGTGKNLAVTFFCGSAIKTIRDRLGRTVTLYAVAGSSESAKDVEDIRRIRTNLGGQLALLGFSAGGGAVRRLLDVLDPDVAILADGGATSLPGRPQKMPRSQYDRFVALAKAGERRLIYSHTYLEYVEKLPPAQGPYRSTVGVARDMTGWALPEPAPLPPPARAHAITHDPNWPGLTVLSWESGNADAPAHARQLTEVLPMMVDVWLRPWFEGDAPEAPPIAAPIDIPALGAYLSHGWRCAVSELVTDARALKRWHDWDEVRAGVYVVKVGDLVVSKRAGGDPRRGGLGHVERVTARDPSGRLATIGGNESNMWIEAPLVIGPDVIGVIDVDPLLGIKAVELSRAERDANVREYAGTAAHPQIQAYHAGARRGGPLNPKAGMPGAEKAGSATLGKGASDEIAWCASAASWAAYCAAIAIGAGA